MQDLPIKTIYKFLLKSSNKLVQLQPKMFIWF